jgi:nucleotide-binding universal stress UspA family protein
MTLADIDTTVQELRVATRASAFTHRLAHVVTALGVLPDDPPAGFGAPAMTRLRQLVEETIDAVERRIDAGGDAPAAQQQLAGTIYEIRRRMEVIERWFTHRESA